MFDRARYRFDVEVIVEGLELSVDELLSIVIYDGARHCEPTHNVLPNEVLYVLGEYGRERFDFYPLHKVVDRNHQMLG